MEKAKIFARITKIDEAKRLVFGRMVQETADNSAEVFDYASSVPYFKAWSDDVKKASGGKSLGNVRAMHGSVAAGKVEDMILVPAEKAIDIATKVVDDQEWQKCLDGVYTGFSIGGRYVRKWTDPENKALTRYTAKPIEVSLVDRPMIPSCTFFEIQKADGTLQKKDFVVQKEEKKDDEFEYEFINKADGKPLFKVKLGDAIADVEPGKTIELEDGEYLVSVVKELKAEGNLHKFQLTVDVKKAATEKPEKDDAADVDTPVEGTAEEVAELGKLLNTHKLSLSDVLSLVKASVEKKKAAEPKAEAIAARCAELAKAQKVDFGKLPEGPIKAAIVKEARDQLMAEAEEDTFRPAEFVAVKLDEVLERGLSECAQFAYLIDALYRFCHTVDLEQKAEGDNSTVGSRIKEACYSLGQLLRDLVIEEVEEEQSGTGARHHSDTAYARYFEQATDMVKFLGDGYGEEFAKTLAKSGPAGFHRKCQKAHDLVTEMGVKCDMPYKLDDAAEMQKAYDEAPAAKAAGLSLENFTRLCKLHGTLAGMGAKCSKLDEADEDGIEKVDRNVLSKIIADAVAAATAPLKAEIAALGKVAAPSKVSLKVVSKGDDHRTPGERVEVTPIMTSGKVNESATAIKNLHVTGGTPWGLQK